MATESGTWSDGPRRSRGLGATPFPGRPPRGIGATAALIAAIFGGIGLIVSLTGLTIGLLPRSFSASQQRQIMAWELAKRWRTMPAGDIFPPSASYQLPASALDDVSGVNLQVARVGIAPQATCASGTDAAAGRVLGRAGCRALLRATYTDESATYVVTVGVAVLPGAAGASAAQAALARLAGKADAGPGVRPVAFGGTPSGQFGDGQRQITHAFSAGPYLIMYTAGYADGRPTVSIGEDSYAENEMTSMALGAAQAVARPIDAPPPAPHCPGTPGC